MAAHMSPHFAALLDSIGQDAGQPVTLSAPHVFEMLLPGDLPVRVTVHPNGVQLVIDLYLYSAAMLTGPARAGLIQAALMLNHMGLRGRRFALGLDNRDFLLLTATVPLDAGSAGRFADQLAYLAAQAQRARVLFRSVTRADVEVFLKPVVQPE